MQTRYKDSNGETVKLNHFVSDIDGNVFKLQEDTSGFFIDYGNEIISSNIELILSNSAIH